MRRPKLSVSIQLKSIVGNFFPESISDFISVMEVSLFDRGKKLDESLTNNMLMREEFDKYKANQIISLIKQNRDGKSKAGVIYPFKSISYALKNVDINLYEDKEHFRSGDKFCSLTIYDANGFHTFYSDEGIETNISINKIWVEHVENKKCEFILGPFVDANRAEFHSSDMRMITVLCKDTYEKGLKAKWKYVEQYEANIHPLCVKLPYDVYRKIKAFILSSESSEKKEETEELPSFYSYIRLNELNLVISYVDKEGALTIDKMPFKFNAFVESNKLWTKSDLIERIEKYVKSNVISSIPTLMKQVVVGGLEKKKNEKSDEDKMRELLFGKM